MTYHPYFFNLLALIGTSELLYYSASEYANELLYISFRNSLLCPNPLSSEVNKNVCLMRLRLEKK